MKDMKEVRGLVGKLVSGLFIVVLLLCAVLAVLCPSAFAATTWSKTYGGAKAEGHSGGAVVDSIYPYVMQTSDGGFLLTGDTSSFGAGSNDAYLVKTDANGVVQWQKTYGGPLNESACMVWPTNDGGYAIAAITNSYGAGGHDAWLLKTDATGNLQWNKTYGGTGEDMAWIVWQTADGGYLIGGSTTSFGAGSHDAWLTKTDANGNMLWNKTYGGAGNEFIDIIIRTSDGGYAMAGYTDSFGAGSTDLWLIKTDANFVSTIPVSPSASAFSSVTVLSGWTWWFFVHSNGGVAPYTYQWYEGTTPIQGQTSMVLSVTKTARGVYEYYCQVTDSQGITINTNTISLTVI